MGTLSLDPSKEGMRTKTSKGEIGETGKIEAFADPARWRLYRRQERKRERAKGRENQKFRRQGIGWLNRCGEEWRVASERGGDYLGKTSSDLWKKKKNIPGKQHILTGRKSN